MSSYTHLTRSSLRTLLRRPGFSALVVLLIALGVGAPTAMWTVVRGILFEPLPFEEPDDLALLRISVDGVDRAPSLSAPELVDFRERSSLLVDIAAEWNGWTVLRPDDGALSGQQSAERLQVGWITANLFSLLGREPVIGRSFTEAEERPEGPNDVAILSHRLWQRRFSGDPDILGRRIVFADGPRTVVGVMPEGFRTMLNARATNRPGADLWIPNTYWQGRDVHWLRAVARRAPGVSWDRAQAEVVTITEQLNSEFMEYAATPATFHLDALVPELTRAVRPSLIALSSMAVLVLLIAIANTTALFQARAESRRREFATRASLGASRRQLLRDALLETVPLVLLGGAAASAVALVATRVLLHFRPPSVPRLDEIAYEGSAFLIALALSFLASLIALALSLLRRGHTPLHDQLRASRAEVHDNSRSHSLLLTAQVALALVLVAGSALLLRSFDRVHRVDLGFRPDGIATLRLNVPVDTYDSAAQRQQFLLSVQNSLTQDPDISGAGAVNILPLSGGMLTGRFESIDGSQRGEADYRSVTPGYLESLGARLLEGRWFDQRDVIDERRVLIIDDLVAQQMWPNQSALGKRLKVGLFEGDDLEPSEVVGVVSHLRYESVRDPGRPQIHQPYRDQTPVFLTVSSALPPHLIGQRLSSHLHAIDPGVPLSPVRSLRSYVNEDLTDLGFALAVLGAFAAIALGLMLAGTYGVVAYWVRCRLPSVGLRMALGAQPSQVLPLVLRRGLLPCLAGIAVGVLIALAASRLIRSLLFETSALDPSLYLAVSLAILVVATLACLIPARRAMRVDPSVVLRQSP